MKLCRDCRHATDEHKCMHPQLFIRSTNYWDGKRYIVNPSCQEARMLTECNREGTLWEPREVGFGEYDEKQT